MNLVTYKVPCKVEQGNEPGKKKLSLREHEKIELSREPWEPDEKVNLEQKAGLLLEENTRRMRIAKAVLGIDSETSVDLTYLE
jgi:hypothetical protein